MAVPSDNGSLLLVGGTRGAGEAESLHAGDVRAQTRESLERLAALFDAAAQQGGPPLPAPCLDLRVYVAREEDRSIVAATADAFFGAATAIEYVLADLPAPECLVDAEGCLRRFTSS